MVKIIGATGHRPEGLGSYSKDTGNKIIKLVINHLQNIEVDEVISGAAIGYDTYFTLAALSLKIPITLAIPFYNQPNKWNSFDKEIYSNIIKRAKAVIYVDELVGTKYNIPSLKVGEYYNVKMQLRNQYIVDNCTTLLALWNGETKGGTYNCIKYAQSQNKEIINLWDKYVTI